MSIKWGIMGTANIAKKNIRALQLSSVKANHQLIAVASRSIEKAKAFIEENCLNQEVTAYGSYDDLLKSDLHAVYIPLPSAVHLEWVIKAAQAKKHILLEKPTALNSETYQLMMAECVKYNVFLMDGVMFMHHSRLDRLRDILKDPFTGKVSKLDIFSIVYETTIYYTDPTYK